MLKDGSKKIAYEMLELQAELVRTMLLFDRVHEAYALEEEEKRDASPQQEIEFGHAENPLMENIATITIKKED